MCLALVNDFINKELQKNNPRGACCISVQIRPQGLFLEYKCWKECN